MSESKVSDQTVNCETCQDDGTLPDGSGCPDCCPHDENDHFVCMDCGKELDPGAFIDAAEYAFEDR